MHNRPANNEYGTPYLGSRVISAINAEGLGIRDIENQMKASQAHTVWRFLANPNALSVNLLTQKYLKTTSFSEYKVRPLDSNTWKMIVRNITILFG